MAQPLVPAPSSLGLASPALGPWFDDATLTLGAPGGDLSVTVSPTGAAKWLPPARGILSLYFATPTRPAALARLRAANGQKAFTDNRLVGLFWLLPEIESRLEALARNLPSPDVNAATAPTRPVPRWFALESTSVTTASTVAAVLALWTNGHASSEDTDTKKLASIGLGGSDGALGNGEKAATILLGPEHIGGSGDSLLQLDTGVFRLWAFDTRGRAIDPGAVAAWWARLATTTFDNLWAGSGADQRTCPVAAARTLHLVGAHEGPVPAALLARTDVGGAGGAATDNVRTASGTAAVTIGFTAAPATDDAPLPRAALLPHGAYGASLSLWPSGPVAADLARDYARVALVDVESHLTGQPRAAASVTPTEGDTRRAADQDRAATRVRAARAERGTSGAPPLRADIDAVADALIALAGSPQPVTLVTPQLDRDYGPLPPLAAAAGALPSQLPTPSVRALTGGGAASGGTVAGQKVLIEFAMDPALAGARLRLWPNAVDLASGRRKAQNGGAGRVRADGTVSLVALLPDGADAASELGATAVIVLGGATRLYGELRFTRPLAAGGAPLAWGSATGAVIACEQERFPSSAAAVDLLPGTALVHDDGAAASLIDPATVPAAVFAPATAIRALAAGDRIVLTRPAFREEPAGSPAALLGAGGATATEQARTGVTRSTGPGTPLPSQHALTSAAAAIGATSARAVLIPPPALSRYHEIGPVQRGHPGAPATAETAGVGADIDGPAALLLAEAIDATVETGTPELAAAAASSSNPPDPSGAALWAAALRTQAAGVEGERGMSDEVAATAHPYPFDGDEAAQRQWYLDNASITVAAPAAGQEAAQQRALARRALAAGFGLQESAVALAAAFARAEDFVYLETPALDVTDIGGGEDILRPLQALVDRLTAQPTLHLVACVPVQAFAGAPADYARIRADGLKSALASLAAAAPGRFASFCPSAGAGRSLRLATTAVIVDDVFALIGSTHLSRRGLSFDSSLAVAVFDEQCDRGRGQSLTNLRRQLIGARLGLPTTLVPDEGAALVGAVIDLTRRGNFRLTLATLPAADPPVTAADRDLWNRDGTPRPDPADLATWLTLLSAGNVLN